MITYKNSLEKCGEKQGGERGENTKHKEILLLPFYSHSLKTRKCNQTRVLGTHEGCKKGKANSSSED